MLDIAGVAPLGIPVPRLQVADNKLPVVRHALEMYLVDEREDLPGLLLSYDPSAPDPLENVNRLAHALLPGIFPFKPRPLIADQNILVGAEGRKDKDLSVSAFRYLILDDFTRLVLAWSFRQYF